MNANDLATLAPSPAPSAPAPPAAPGRVLPALAELPAGALLDESALAAALGVCKRTVRAMVARAELPPPVRLGGRSTWLAGRVLGWIAAAAERAEREAEKNAARWRNTA